jgi:Fe-S-cluster-containing dehydrogenase component
VSTNGILVDYDYCTGCHACEIACKQEHRIPENSVGGIKIIEMVLQLHGGKLDVSYYPYFTHLCFFCYPRTKKGLLPACVQHCMAKCLELGNMENLLKSAPQKRKVAMHLIRLPEST